MFRAYKFLNWQKISATSSPLVFYCTKDKAVDLHQGWDLAGWTKDLKGMCDKLGMESYRFKY